MSGTLLLRKIDDNGPGVEPAADLLVRASTSLVQTGTPIGDALAQIDEKADTSALVSGLGGKTDLDSATSALKATQLPKAVASRIIVTPSLSDLNAAIASLAATYDPGTGTGGGDIHLPAITLTGSSVALRSGVRLKGRGKGNTILKLANNVNSDVLYGFDTYTWLGQLNDKGIKDWSVEDLTIDGNRANNTAGCGIKVFGFKYNIRSVELLNCADDALYTDGGAYVSRAMESKFHDILIDTCGANGWRADGPHDSDASCIIIIDAGQKADNAFAGLFVNTNMNGRFRGVHPWHNGSATNRMSYALRDIGVGSEYSVCHFEGSRTACAVLEGSRVQMSACRFYASYGSDCIAIRGTAHNIEGYVEGGLPTQPNAGQRAVVLGYGSDYCASNTVRLRVHQAQNCLVDFANSQGGNYLDIRGFVSGPPPSGTPPAGYRGTPKATDHGSIWHEGATVNAKFDRRLGEIP